MLIPSYEKKIKVGASTLETLQEIAKVTQKLFPDIETTHADNFVQKSLKMGNPFLSLSVFMQHGIGVCRQHALLNAYLMSRLVDEKLLQGEVIHQRHTFPEQGAHVWNLFRDAKDGKLYSLDSLWKHVVSLADNPGSLNRLYGLDVEKGIKDVFGEFRLLIKQNEPSKVTAQAMPSISPKSFDKLIEIVSPPKNAFIEDEFPEDGPDLVISPKAARAPIQVWVDDEDLNDYRIPVLSPKMGWEPNHFWVEDGEHDDYQALALSPKLENAPKHLLVENDKFDDWSIPHPSPKGKIEPEEDGAIGFYEPNEIAEDDHDLVLSPRVKNVPKLGSDDEELADYHDLPLSPKVDRAPKHLLIDNDEPYDNFDEVLSPKALPALYNPQDLLNADVNLKLAQQKTTPIEPIYGFFKTPSIKEQIEPKKDDEDSTEDDNIEIIRYLIKHGEYDNHTDKIDDTELNLNKGKSFG